jgi:hypothetical protein
VRESTGSEADFAIAYLLAAANAQTIRITKSAGMQINGDVLRRRVARLRLAARL